MAFFFKLNRQREFSLRLHRRRVQRQHRAVSVRRFGDHRRACGRRSRDLHLRLGCLGGDLRLQLHVAHRLGDLFRDDQIRQPRAEGVQIPPGEAPARDSPIHLHVQPVANGDVAQSAPHRFARPRDGVMRVEPIAAVFLLPLRVLRPKAGRLPKAVGLHAAAQRRALAVRRVFDFVDFLRKLVLADQHGQILRVILVVCAAERTRLLKLLRQRVRVKPRVLQQRRVYPAELG